MPNRKSESCRMAAVKRAIAAALALAALSAATGCTGGDSARERPAAPGYQRLPIR